MEKDIIIDGLVLEENVRKISEDELIVIGACDGSKTLAGAKRIFLAGIDSGLKSWCDTDKPSHATKEQEVAVYQVAQDSDFADMFSAIDSDVHALCLTQAQIIDFCQRKENFCWLGKGKAATFFLFECEGYKGERQLYVADVRVIGYGLSVCVVRFSNNGIWQVRYGSHRVVVPQLTA